MPIDRPNQNTPRPLKPTLASNRTAKTPITPRLAAAPSATPTSSSQSTRTTRSSNGTTPRPNATGPENVTPAKVLLNSNVTPRSSSRKSRVGFDSISPTNTPTATPSAPRPASTIDFHKEQGIGYNGQTNTGINGAQNGVRPRSIAGQGGNHTTPTPRLPLFHVQKQGSSENGAAKDVSSLFFHADDVKPHEQPIPQKKATVFFHANGKQGDTPRNKSVPSPPLSSLGRPQSDSKFFHADSLSEGRDRPPILTPPPISASPELLPPPNTAVGASLRPASPTKEWSHLSYRKGASQVIRPALTSRTSGNSALSILAGPNTPEVPDNNRRKSSAAQSAVRFGHTKSASLSSINSATELKRAHTAEQPTMTPSPLHTENRLINASSVHDSTASVPSPSGPTFSGLPSPAPMSPTAAAGSKSTLDTLNELAANARRERKVLDLEISNSSLLAINRSLEKEIRKQKAELRRFRRLSRAGRFSVDPASSTPESFHAVGTGSLGELSDMSEAEEEEPVEEEDDPEDSESSLDEGALSPSLQAERDEAHRLRDEKRLQLDLSKHRELLVDSQKMNQSLKRCLGWTEQLIKDGQKALEYKVHVSDVKLGGRVLISEDDDIEACRVEESRGLLSPWSPLHSAMDALDSPFFTDASRLIDRDSGVDLDALEPVEHGTDVPLPASPTNASRSPDKEFRPRVPGRWESFATHTRPQSGVLDDFSALGSPFEEKLKDLHASIDALEAS